MSESAVRGVEAKNRRASEIRARLVMAPLVLLVVAGVLWLHARSGEAAWTHAVLALIAALGGAELARIFQRAGLGGNPWQAAVGCACLCGVGLLVHLGHDTPATAVAARIAVLVIMLLWVLLERLTDTRREAAVEMACRLVPLLYVGLLFSSLAWFAAQEEGALWVALIVLTAKASDMAGWAVGLPFGRHKMLPSVSPGKSWEGTAAGLLASALVGVFLPGLLGPSSAADWSVVARAAFGFLLGLASILAGFTWSGWKRRLGTKDSSTHVPGLGGVLDMIDSILLAGPAAYLFCQLHRFLGWPGP